MPLSAIALNCSLKPSNGEASSTQAMIDVLRDALAEHDVTLSRSIRIADHTIKPGVTSDEGEGDEWPAIRTAILEHDIMVIGTPIWLGHPSSLAQRVLERMDAFISEADEKGRMPSFGMVAVAAIVGNEDGAHHVSAQLFQGLNDLGFTIPATAACYWVGEAMQPKDFKDFDQTPGKVSQTAAMVASNAAHLAGLLKGNPYPG